MVKSLQEQIKEHEAELGENPNEGEENVRRNDEPSETARSKRPRAATEIDETEDVGSEQRGKRGRNGNRTGGRRGERTEDEGTSQAGAETSQDDEEAPRSNSGRASGDGRTSRNAARPTDAGAAPKRELLTDEEGDDEENEIDNPVAMARLRRENRELKAEKLRLEAERGTSARDPAPPAQEKKPETVNTDPEPADKASPLWDKWKIRDQERRLAKLEGRTQEDEKQTQVNTQIREAVDQFKTVRDKYIAKNPDFVPAFKHGYDRYAEALRITKPGWTQEQVVKQADWDLLVYAGECARKGIDPAEAIYDMCIERFGYRPGQQPRTEQRRQVQDDHDDAGDGFDEAPARKNPNGVRQRTNLRVINNNKRRSASGLNNSGQGGSASLTKEAAAGMTLGELANLDTDMWDQLENLG